MATERSRGGDRRRWAALVVLSLGQLMIFLDGTVVNVALPSIQRDLGFSEASLAWVVNAYLVTFGGLLLLAGRLGDLFGRKRVFLAGLSLFTLASLLCGLSTSAQMLVAARFLQGVGAAASSAMVLGIVVTIFPAPAERTRAMSAYAFVANTGGSLGLLLGGAITQAFSWHWIFIVNLPIGLLGVVLANGLIDDDGRAEDARRPDWLGALLIVGAPTLAVYAIVSASTYSWGSLRTIGMLVLAVVLGVVFVVHQRRSENPLVPLSLLAQPVVSSANLLRVFHGFGMSCFFFLGALYLQDALGFSAFRTGLAYLPSNLVVGICSLVVTTRLVRRFGATRLLPFGFGLVVAAELLLSRAPDTAAFVPWILPAMLLTGFGASFVFMPSITLAMSTAGPTQSGFASGLANVSVQLGGAFGTAIAASVASLVTRRDLAHGAANAQALTGGYHVGFLIGAGGALTGALLSIRLVLHRVEVRAPVQVVTSPE